MITVLSAGRSLARISKRLLKRPCPRPLNTSYLLIAIKVGSLFVHFGEVNFFWQVFLAFGKPVTRFDFVVYEGHN